MTCCWSKTASSRRRAHAAVALSSATTGPPRVAGHILAEGLERIDELVVPDPVTTPPMSYCIDAVRILRKELGDRVFIMGRADQGR